MVRSRALCILCNYCSGGTLQLWLFAMVLVIDQNLGLFCMLCFVIILSCRFVNSTYACDAFGWLFWLGGSLFCCKFSGLISFREICVWFWIECCLLPTYGGHYRIHMKFVCIKQRTTGNITIFSVISIMHQKSSCHNHLWWNQNVYIFATNKTMSSFRKS